MPVAQAFRSRIGNRSEVNIITLAEVAREFAPALAAEFLMTVCEFYYNDATRKQSLSIIPQNQPPATKP
jgi:hypothetical protein